MYVGTLKAVAYRNPEKPLKTSHEAHILSPSLSLHAKLGPIITLHFGSRPAIFIADRFLSHQALVQNGAIFADRPPPLDGREQVVITTAVYGPTWRVLGRNLTAEMLHSSRVKSYSYARKVVLERLLKLLKDQSDSADRWVEVTDQFRNSMFSLLAFMCFGKELEEQKIKEIAELQEKLRGLIVPLILDRKKLKQEKSNEGENQDDNKHGISFYVDTLLDVKLPEENRSLDVEEILGLCSEFLNGGTDNTSALLQWIMANLVKNPHIQQKLFMEIKGVIGNEEKMVKEDDLHEMPYLKAVILEGLRRHPPLRFLLHHAVTEDVVLDGYFMPRNGTMNFMIGDMGMDPKVWEDPMSFKPERFVMSAEDGEGFDITGSKEIKMMPFGARRRICPTSSRVFCGEFGVEF
ncbi:hypothetical protein GOBAR_DD05521 [Gossypium barbadense]|nr:hypothetical protein GOBAR_DD05521 [Gossypium barbadense]